MFLACEILSAAAEQSRRAGERAARILPLTSTRVLSIIIMYIYVQAVQSIRKADGRKNMRDRRKKFRGRLSLLLIVTYLFSILFTTAGQAAYGDGYAGGMQGEGRGIYAYGIDISSWQGHEVDFIRSRPRAMIRHPPRRICHDGGQHL